MVAFTPSKVYHLPFSYIFIIEVDGGRRPMPPVLWLGPFTYPTAA